MQSDLCVRRISPEGVAAIHSYFDLCPESRCGRWILYFEFANGRPGPGRVVVQPASGGERRILGRVENGSAHTGAMQQWVGMSEVAFISGEKTVLTGCESGNERTYPGHIRMFSPVHGMGLCFAPLSPERPTMNQAVHLVTPGQSDAPRLFAMHEAIERHPLRERLPPAEFLNFKHAKWSPDGKSFFVRIGVAKSFHRERANSAGVLHDYSIMVGRPNGEKPVFIKAWGHHPMWSPCGRYIYAGGKKDPLRAQPLTAFPVDGGPPQAVLESAWTWHGSLSPDGQFLVSDVCECTWLEPGCCALVLYEHKTLRMRELARFPLPDASHETGCHPHPVWSRDGSRIYFNAPCSGRPALHVLHLP